MANRATQVISEVLLEEPNPTTRTTQNVSEVLLWQFPPMSRMTQVVAEVLIGPAMPAPFPLPVFPARWLTGFGRTKGR